MISSVESRFSELLDLYWITKQTTETKVYECSAVAGSFSDSRFSSTGFPALLCLLVLTLFVGSLFLLSLLLSFLLTFLLSLVFVWKGASPFYAFGGQLWLTVSDSRS